MSSFTYLYIWLRDRYGLDPRSLALLRIGLGSILLYDLTNRFIYLLDHYTDSGVIPRWALTQKVMGPWDLSLHLVAGNSAIISIFFGVGIIAAVCILIGYKTRLALVASLVLLISLHQRNPLILQSGDHVIKMLLFWSIFLPVSERFSLSQPLNNGSNKKIFNVASFGLMMQIITLYVLAGFAKMAERHWLGGDALFLAFAARDISGELGQALIGFPKFLKFATENTLYFEILVPFLLLVPWKNAWIRLVLIAIYSVFHIAIGFTLNVAIFIFVPLIAWSALLPGCFWNWIRVGQSVGHYGADLKIRLKNQVKIKKSRALSFLRTSFLGLCIFLISSWTYYSLPGMGNGFPQMFKPFFLTLGLSQSYGVFAVTLPRAGWFWIPAQLSDGSRVELSINGTERIFRKNPPDMDPSNRLNDRWGKYIESLTGGFWFLRENHGIYLCEQWKKNNSTKRNLETFVIYYVTTKINTDGAYSSKRVENLWTHECTAGAVDKWKAEFLCQLPGETCDAAKKL